MSLTIKLPFGASRTLETFELSTEPLRAEPPQADFNRIALSAAHVVADPFGEHFPGAQPVIDWDSTLSYRRYLLEQGLGIAEAMDTAQRGMGLEWPQALELVKRTLEGTSDIAGATIFSGCGTDQLDDRATHTLDDIRRAYGEQLDALQPTGTGLIIMASRALARATVSSDDYVAIYGEVLRKVEKPAILHWLGDMFDPALKGYWGTDQFEQALETVIEIIETNVAQIDGIKISLLDKDKEIQLRRRLPASVKMYTGDDFNYPELIAGDEQGHSHALLGIFDAIAPAAAQALGALAAGDQARYDELLAPTVPLARCIFRAPTRFYKTGVVFLAWLNGHQDHFSMLAGHQAMRPLDYFVSIFKLAHDARLLAKPDLAVARMRSLLALHGIGG